MTVTLAGTCDCGWLRRAGVSTIGTSSNSGRLELPDSSAASTPVAAQIPRQSRNKRDFNTGIPQSKCQQPAATAKYYFSVWVNISRLAQRPYTSSSVYRPAQIV